MCLFRRDSVTIISSRLTAERRVPIKSHGFVTYRWEKDARQANEMLDCMIVATAAAIRAGVYSLSDRGWAALIEQRALAPIPRAPAPAPAQVPTPEPTDAESLRRIQEMFAEDAAMLTTNERWSC